MINTSSLSQSEKDFIFMDTALSIGKASYTDFRSSCIFVTKDAIKAAGCPTKIQRAEEEYDFTAVEDAVLKAASTGISLEGSTAYITCDISLKEAHFLNAVNILRIVLLENAVNSEEAITFLSSRIRVSRIHIDGDISKVTKQNEKLRKELNCE